jgi:nucleoside-diphosphate-sugar epimerase
MRVLLAGATGAIGRPLSFQLIAAGHRVIGLTRSAEKTGLIRASGAEPAVCNVFDLRALRTLLGDLRPDAVIHQLTALPQRLNIRKLKSQYSANNRIRREGTRNLLEAATRAGVQRFLIQSMASWYRPGGAPLKTENDPLYLNAPEPVGKAVRALRYMEQIVFDSGLEWTVLRYGAFYGPGTWFGKDGAVWQQVRKRIYPQIGSGSGVYSWIHVDDAAAATVKALESGPTGIYNVVDDEPAPVHEWLPLYAAAIGARPPRKVPCWAAAMFAGGLVKWETTMPGASNQKIKSELNWAPRYTTWRTGFPEEAKAEAPVQPG